MTASASSHVPLVSGRIPLVDLAGARTPEGRARIAEAIARCCRDTGFFYVVNHGIPADVVSGAFAASRRFFEQPDAAKLAVFQLYG